MAQDKVQLKREEIVGNEVVLQDINPKTKTNSIIDSAKGAPLDETLARMWNSINNKLQRVVNSVNGRTGVVLLDANDVGLGNVDNVSFGDIKKWVIDTIAETFETKRIIVKTYLSEIDAILGGNDKALENTAFFSEYGEEGKNDYLSYIGYIYWNDSESPAHLDKVTKAIRVIGYTDRSLVYNKDASTPTRTDRNMSGGGLAVNIWKGEDALKVYNNAISGPNGHSASDLNNSGLYIDKEKIVPDVYFFDGVYGDMTPGSPDALIYYNTDTSVDPSKYHKINIKIDGKDVNLYSHASNQRISQLYTHQKFKKGDIIFCNFNDEGYYGHTSLVDCLLYPGMVDALTYRQHSVGRVTQAPDYLHPDATYVVEFFQLSPNVTNGLKLEETNTSTEPMGSAISLDTLSGPVIMKNGNPVYDPNWSSNVSGINTLTDMGMVLRNKKPNRKITTILPTGESDNILPNDDGKSHPAFITPNFSLCVIPYYTFTHGLDSPAARPITNWPVSGPAEPSRTDMGQMKYNMLGVNLVKTIGAPELNEIKSRARNISGLRINTDSQALGKSWFGFGEGEDKLGYDLQSGGLSVNVGKFLCIGSPEELTSEDYKKSNKYYDEGKVNVRIDESTGLCDVGDNTLGIKLYKTEIKSNGNGGLGGGLSYEEWQTGYGIEKGLCVDRGLGLRMSYYKRQGEIYPGFPVKSENPIHLAVSLFDPGYGSDDLSKMIGSKHIEDLYGGLRYIQGSTSHNCFNAIGVRVNESNELYGDKLKKGSEGLTITRNNVLGVQRGQGLAIDDEGSLTIKISSDFAYNTDNELVLSQPSANVDVLRIIDKNNNMAVYNPTGNLPAGFIDITLGPGLMITGGISADDYHASLLTGMLDKIDCRKPTSMKLAQIFTFYDNLNVPVSPSTARNEAFDAIDAYIATLNSSDAVTVLYVSKLIGRVENKKIMCSESLETALAAEPLYSKYTDTELIDCARGVYKGTHLKDEDRIDILTHVFNMPLDYLEGFSQEVILAMLDESEYSKWAIPRWSDICDLINTYNAKTVQEELVNLGKDAKSIPYMYGMLEYSGWEGNINDVTASYIESQLNDKIQSYEYMTVLQRLAERSNILNYMAPHGIALSLNDFFTHDFDYLREKINEGLGKFMFNETVSQYNSKNVISISRLSSEFGLPMNPDELMSRDANELKTTLADYLVENVPINTIYSSLIKYETPETSAFRDISVVYTGLNERLQEYTVIGGILLGGLDPSVNTGNELISLYLQKTGEYDSKRVATTLPYFMKVQDFAEVKLNHGVTSAGGGVSGRENMLWKDFQPTLVKTFTDFYDANVDNVDTLTNSLWLLVHEYDLDIAEININDDTKQQFVNAIQGMTIEKCLRFIADERFVTEKSGDGESPDSVS